MSQNNLGDDFEKEWPNLNNTIRREARQKSFFGTVEIIIGQNNLWTLVQEKVI